MDHKSLVYKGSPPDHCCCGAALREMPSGEWVCLFLTGEDGEPRKGNFVGLCRSSDRGEVWSPLEAALRFDDRACLNSEVYVDGGDLVAFVHTHAGRFDDWRNFTIRSADAGRTWTEPEVFEPMPKRAFFWCTHETSWGEWLLPFELFPYDEAAPDPLPAPHADGAFKRTLNGTLISSDRGRTWTASNAVGPVPGWAENNVVELSGERLVMLSRADGTGHLVRMESTDRGRTWTSPEPTDIPNPGTKFRLHRLSDGRIVLVHNPNARTSHPNSKKQCQVVRNPLAMWISDDEMTTWGYKRVLTDYPGMLAYPEGFVDEEEGYVHFAFDYNRHDVIYWGARLP